MSNINQEKEPLNDLEVASTKDLMASNQALEQIIKYLTKTPVLFLIGFFVLCSIVAVVFIIKLLMDSREREQRLNDKMNDRMIELFHNNAPGLIKEELKPTINRVVEVADSIEKTTYKVDSLINNSK